MLVGGFVTEAFTPSELEPTTWGGCIISCSTVSVRV